MNNISKEDFNQKKKFTISNQIGGKGTLRRKGIKKNSSLLEKKKILIAYIKILIILLLKLIKKY